MTTPPLAAVGLPPDTPYRSAGGATGRLWRVETTQGPCALRHSYSPGELPAMTAAREAGVPVPEVLRSAALEQGVAILLRWEPGATIIESLLERPERAEPLGRAVGAAQRRLHQIQAPADLPPVNGWLAPDGVEIPPGETLLHLDYHWLNVLVDGDNVTGVLDWENARRGDPVLDLARTYCLLNVEPTLDQLLTPQQRQVAREFAAAWAAGYGPQASAIPAWALAWGGRTMLDNIAHRFADHPEALDGLVAWTRSCEQKADRETPSPGHGNRATLQT